ncbi:MAG: phosphoenolpyruvate carboxylase [Collinsella sp.]
MTDLQSKPQSATEFMHAVSTVAGAVMSRTRRIDLTDLARRRRSPLGDIDIPAELRDHLRAVPAPRAPCPARSTMQICCDVFDELVSARDPRQRGRPGRRGRRRAGVDAQGMPTTRSTTLRCAFRDGQSALIDAAARGPARRSSSARFTTFFHLANLSEEKLSRGASCAARERNVSAGGFARRPRERALTVAFHQLIEEVGGGPVRAELLSRAWSSIPVFTAHPTEARRQRRRGQDPPHRPPARGARLPGRLRPGGERAATCCRRSMRSCARAPSRSRSPRPSRKPTPSSTSSTTPCSIPSR